MINRYLATIVAMLLLYVLVALLYVHGDARRATERFEHHGVVIADDVWALNKDSAIAYLQLALQRDHFATLTVEEPDGEIFLHFTAPALVGLDSILHQLQLIPLRRLRTDIVYGDRLLARLTGEQYVRVIYPLLNRLVLLSLVSLGIIFLLRQMHNRRILEQQVQERTQNLAKSEKRFHDLVNLLPEMVWETDLSGNVTYANQMAQLRLGFRPDDGPESPCGWLAAVKEEERGRAADYGQALMRGDALGLVEFTAVATDGQFFPMLLRSAPITGGGAITGARCVAIDITERHDLEEQLRRAQHMKTIGLMAGGVAHDLNNILSGLVTYPELLLLDLDQKSPLRPALETIRKSGVAAAEVVADLLTVARGVASAREPVNPNDLIVDYLASPDFLQLQSLYPQVAMHLGLADDLAPISCSAAHVRKCLMNLVTNAAEAIGGSGEIRIRSETRQLESTEAAENGLAPGLYSIITVADDGPGISREDLDHIFEPFYTRKVMGRSGTGLGLTVVWNTVREHDGMVQVRSGAWGTRFTLYFPATRNVAPGTGQELVDHRIFRGRGEHILVVDDERQQLEIAEKILQSLNYQVTAVDSGEKAVEYVRQHRVDLLVLDMLMEPGQNGLATYSQIRQLHPEQKAIVVTGFSESADIDGVLALGAGSLVHKPYTIGQLGQAVYRELQGSEPAAMAEKTLHHEKREESEV